MSKYRKLWYYLEDNCLGTETLSFSDIYMICGGEVNSEFMDCRRECEDFGFSIQRIDMNRRTVTFARNAGNIRRRR
ncbi:MAG: hypothetical protein J6N15_11875 [Ruminiclostridium sp.]|nr:hypothetical protein [Ruminiclostridium sp.]